MQTIIGGQMLFLFFASAMGFHQITGAGTGVSLLVGGFGGVMAIYGLYRSFPRSVLGLAAGAWAVGGFVLGNALFGTALGTLIPGLIGAAIGFAANKGWFAEMDASFAKGEAWAGAVLPPIVSQQDREGLVVLWHAVRRLDRMKVMDEATANRLNGEIAGLLRMPNPPEGSAPMLVNDVADGFKAARMLQANGLIGAAEADGIRARIEARQSQARPSAGTTAARAPVPPRAPMGVNPDGSLTETEREKLAAYLPKLAENRALSAASYARVMAVLDPASAERNLAAIDYPFEDSADTDDLETVERLHKAGLIDATEYRRGLQVILPYLHTTGT
ncbi:MAG: hypothetical protein E6Q73_07255 [Pseudorhodobacter sp.]|nr:MAG: hypothetical protein E6Q73_07255 [Pseudorhodobacter sp.]